MGNAINATYNYNITSIYNNGIKYENIIQNSALFLPPYIPIYLFLIPEHNFLSLRDSSNSSLFTMFASILLSALNSSQFLCLD